MIPLGIRNNNPGNLEWGGFTKSLGATGPGDGGRFARFPTMEKGICAAATNLISYQEHFGIETIRQVVNRWAPGTENNVVSYIDFMCHVCELGPDDKLDFHDHNTLYWLCTAIFEEENGHDAFTTLVSDAVLEAGIQAALT
jgi:hypothetical protein